MLRFLAVRHLAVLDRLEIEFEPGLNVLTGETGAGKTVLVEAIDLLVGGRASADLVRTGEEIATVQAIFERAGGADVIVRREVSAQGRSRAFIDDALATSTALRDFGARHIDLHGQHEHQALLDPAEHVGLLDVFAGHSVTLETVRERHAAWRAAVNALDRTRLGEREKRARIEMASFQLQEIDRAAPKDGEDEALDAERRILANADRLSRLSSEAYAKLYEGEGAAIGSLAIVWKRLAELAEVDERFLPYLTQREDVKARLEDLAYFLQSYAADIEAAPDKLQAVEDRLAMLERLKKKYGPLLSDVLARRSALREEIAALDANAERAEQLEQAASAAEAAFLAAARELSSARSAAARLLARALEKELAELAMPQCRVDVRVRPIEDAGSWTPAGIDDVEFFLSPNPGEELRPLARIASGGELSRVMLALRTVAAWDEAGRTLVFDEVDAGIGGTAADAVGARLQTLAGRHQVVCITHLPAIAARADVHFQIVKHVKGGRTTTAVSKLDVASREQEIARMIAGAKVTPQVLASAREVLASRRRGNVVSENIAKGESERSPWTKAKVKRGGS